MAKFSEVQVPVPKGETRFQDICLKLVRRYWDDDLAELHGRRGQAQHGADITGHDNRNKLPNAAFQCKGSESHEPRIFTEKELEAEVAKAKKFNPPLDILYIGYAGKRDAKLQSKAKELSSHNEKVGLFRIEIWSWDDIVSRAEEFPEIAESLLVRFKNSSTETILYPKRPKTEEANWLDKIQNLLAERQAVISNEIADAEHDDPIAQGKMDVLKSLISEGNGRSAIGGLQQIISNFSLDTSSRVRFRAYANLGAALLQVDEFEPASAALKSAASASSNEAEAAAYKAWAEFVAQDQVEAFKSAEISLNLDKNQKLGAAILLNAAHSSIDTEQLEENVSNLLSDLNVGWSLSRRYSEEKRFDDAIRVARGIEESDENWARDIAIGDAIVGTFEENFDIRVGAPLSSGDAELLGEAIQRLSTAWELIVLRDDRQNWAHAGANLAAALRFSGDDNRADEILLTALSFAPNNLALRQRAAFVHLRRNDYESAFEIATEVAATDGLEQLLFAARIASICKKWAHVTTWATRVFDLSGVDEKTAQAAELLTLAEYRQKDALSALELANKLRAKFSPSITFESRIAEISRRLGDATEIRKSQELIEGFDPATLNALERFELADAFADCGLWSKSADLLNGLHSNDRQSEALTRRLYALYRADRRQDARTLLESLSGSALHNNEIQRLGAAIYERSGLLSKALTCLELALKVAPMDLRSRLDWARLQLRNRNQRAVETWIKQTDTDIGDDDEDRMELAQLLSRFGRYGDARSIGYSILRKNWGQNERLHLAYCGLFLLSDKKKDDFSETGEVAVDTVVSLRDTHDNTIRYRIEDASDEPDVLTPDHPFAKQLLGAKVGETRRIEPNLGDVRTWTIVKVKNKYVDLFHRAMDQHATLFPGSRSLGSFHIQPEDENGFEPIFEQVRRRAQHAEEVSQLYREKFIPIDMAGKLLGVDGVEAGLGLRAINSIRIDNCVGLADERLTAIELALSAKRLLVDPITLSIWQEIGLLAELEQQKKWQLEVVQSTIDALTMRSEAASDALKQEGGSLVAHGDKIALVEPTEKERKVNLKLRIELENWARKHAKVVPTEPIQDGVKDQISAVLTSASADTIATARASERLLICEDRRLRSVASLLGITSSAWTQPVIMAMYQSEMITRTRYVELLAELQRKGIGFVSVGINDFESAIEEEQLSVFKDLAQSLTGRTVDTVSLVQILVEAITLLWIKGKYANIREQFTGIILRALITQREDALAILSVLSGLIERKLNHAHIGGILINGAWQSYLQRFLKGHFIRFDTLS